MISIIVPVYNASKYIQKTIDSVINQTYTDWELILVDDMSKDESCDIIENNEDSRIRLIRKDKNEGAAAARNTGLDYAKGRYIAFVDADDLWLPDKLALELEYMEANKAGFVFTSYCFGDEDASPTGKVARVPERVDYEYALKHTIIFTSTVLFDTEIVEKDLLRMPAIPSEDTATWWNILQTGIIAYGLDKPLVIYRRPAKSLSSNKLVAIERIWNLYRTHAGLSVPKSFICLIVWAFGATTRRIINDKLRKRN